MLTHQSPQKTSIRFPKIGTKTKSVPGSSKGQISPMDLVSAKSWLYYTPYTQFGFKSGMKREIASLTKIMTAMCSLELCEKYSMSLKSTFFKVTSWAASTNGTTANLQSDAWISIQDLLYGLMLPSGNDAAMVLAENIGAVIYFDKAGNKSLIEEIKSIDLTEDYESIKYYMQEFINYMNVKSKHLKMDKTRFGNPHGLDNVNNYSCCEDVLIMAQEAMNSQIFRKVVKTITYKGMFKFFRGGKLVCKPVVWSNTNKLLDKSDIVGIKTGITAKAGGCLATQFKIDHLTEGIVIVLGCCSTEARFKDTSRILEWATEDDTL